MNVCEPREGMLLLRVRLSPAASRTMLGGTHVDAKNVHWLKATVTAAPEKGRANEALIELLSDALGLRKSAFSLIGGQTDRCKTFLIRDAGAGTAARIAKLT